MKPALSPATAWQLARYVREACYQAALTAYEEGRLRGLCDEGALDYALDAIRRVELADLIKTLGLPEDVPDSGCDPQDDPVG